MIAVLAESGNMFFLDCPTRKKETRFFLRFPAHDFYETVDTNRATDFITISWLIGVRSEMSSLGTYGMEWNIENFLI